MIIIVLSLQTVIYGDIFNALGQHSVSALIKLPSDFTCNKTLQLKVASDACFYDNFTSGDKSGRNNRESDVTLIVQLNHTNNNVTL